MKLEEIPALYRHTWAVYESFRKLGFKDDDITYLAAPVVLPGSGDDSAAQVSKGEYLSVVLETQGKKFSAVIGPLDRPFADAQVLWRQILQSIQDGSTSDATLRRMWNESRMANELHFGSLIAALLGQGIDPPLDQKPKTTN